VNRLDKGKAELAKMKSLRSLAGFTLLDSKGNTEIRDQTHICNLNKEIKHGKNWYGRMDIFLRMDKYRPPKNLLSYKPEGHRGTRKIQDKMEIRIQ
jgi:hypothetical protein